MEFDFGEPYLEANQILQGTEIGLKKYNDLNFLESISMYLGVAQILEIKLKYILNYTFDLDFDRTEKWTLGKTVSELKSKQFHPSLVSLLEEVVSNRNYIAHDLLASEIFINSLIPESGFTKNVRILSKAQFNLEQVLFLVDWAFEHCGFKKPTPKSK